VEIIGILSTYCKPLLSALDRSEINIKEVEDLLTYLKPFFNELNVQNAIKGGAKKTTTVELNPKYCEWIERNLALNGNRVGPLTKVIQDDCLHFLKNTGTKFDLIICDPPTFNNSKRKHVNTFSIKDDYPELLNTCIAELNLGGKLFFSTNATSFNLDPKKLPKNLMVESITNKTIPEDFKNTSIHKAWILTKL
jgi:23S rRNA G2069 N7-methylase RlmK/C1962 C5-methylase RlmI